MLKDKAISLTTSNAYLSISESGLQSQLFYRPDKSTVILSSSNRGASKEAFGYFDIHYCTNVPFLTASAMAKKYSDFMIARPCLSSPSTTNWSPGEISNIFLALAGITI